jgi:hypothetical protein
VAPPVPDGGVGGGGRAAGGGGGKTDGWPCDTQRRGAGAGGRWAVGRTARPLQGNRIRIRKKLKIGKASVTEGIVNGIHGRWRSGGARRS